MSEKRPLPEAYWRTYRRVATDRELRSAANNKLTSIDAALRLMQGKPVYGGYLDEIEVSAEDIELLKTEALDLARKVMLTGDPVEDEELVGTIGCDITSVRQVKTASYELQGGEYIDQQFSPFLYSMPITDEVPVNAVGLFDADSYYLAIDLPPKDGVRIGSYTIKAGWEKMRKDDLDITVYLLNEIKSEL